MNIHIYVARWSLVNLMVYVQSGNQKIIADVHRRTIKQIYLLKGSLETDS